MVSSAAPTLLALDILFLWRGPGEFYEFYADRRFRRGMMEGRGIE